jgi:hypothetical protein
LTANATGVFLAALETVFNLFVRNKEMHREKEKEERQRHNTHYKGNKKKSNRAGSILSFLSLFFPNREN